jgi:hypothetical protein
MKLSRKDAAQHIGIALATLDRWIRSGTTGRSGLPPLQVEYGEPSPIGHREVFVVFPDPEPTPAVPPVPKPLPKPLPPKPLAKAEPEPEPYREAVVIHRGIAMSATDAADQERRDRNRRAVQRYRQLLIDSSGPNLHYLRPQQKAAALAEIEAQCAERLRQLNRSTKR